VHERRSGCRIGLLCVPCRGASAASKRAVFRRARAVSVSSAASRGLFNFRRGGRWSEKFLALTAPHFAHHSLAQRIEIVVRAWAHFLRLLSGRTSSSGDLDGMSLSEIPNLS
jgi:hypothetical protein